MASARRKSAVLGIIVGAVLAIGAPAVAWAEDPVEFGSSPVVDTVGALGSRLDEVEAAIDETADANGRQLFVAYVDEFTNPEAADAWTNDTAIANNMGAEDYLLAVAIDGRAYYLSADSEASISDADLQRIMLEVIEPQLRDGNWAQAAIDTAHALGDGGAGRSRRPSRRWRPPPRRAGCRAHRRWRRRGSIRTRPDPQPTRPPVRRSRASPRR